jgi:hypothetical protein
MAKEYTLTNPSPEDFETPTSGEKDLISKTPKQQLHFEISTNPPQKARQVIANVKMNLQKNSEILEISMLWKTPALPFALTSLGFIIMILILGGITQFEKIPPKVPFFYNSVEKNWEQVDKSFVFILPVIIVIIEVLIIQFAVKIFRQDRRLSMILWWLLALLNVLLFIIITQIYSLVT